MTIGLQIKSLLFSFLFGFVAAFFIGCLYYFLYHNKKIIQIITSFVVVLILIIIYFIILKAINNAIFHIYEIFSIILGYIVEMLMSGAIAKGKKK